MISQSHIIRLVENEAYRQLIDRILDNGRCGSAITRRVLRHESCAAPVALGLGLQRLVELTYAPAASSELLAERLTMRQAKDGLFGQPNGFGENVAADREASGIEAPGIQADRESRLAATGVALAALLSWADQCRGAGKTVSSRVIASINAGLAALARLAEPAERSAEAAHVSGDSQFEFNDADIDAKADVDADVCVEDAIAGPFDETARGWAIVLWQIGHRAEFRSQVATDEVMNQLCHAAVDLMDDELGRYAQLMAA